MHLNDIDLPGQLEKHFKLQEHRLVDKITYRGYDIYITEGGPYFNNKSEFPFGFYEAAYAVRSADGIFYQPLAFDYLHDIKERSDESRRLGRIEKAKESAMLHIDDAIKANAH